MATKNVAILQEKCLKFAIFIFASFAHSPKGEYTVATQATLIDYDFSNNYNTNNLENNFYGHLSAHKMKFSSCLYLLINT